MKLSKFACLIVSSALFVSPPLMALPDGNTPPSMVNMSASFAKARAKLRAYDRDFRDAGIDDDIYAFGALDSEGCDINIGNVLVDNDALDVPDDVIVFVQGDIIQSNNCR